ncbi:MAG: ATP-binding protein [Betaproteobacteria bacterium]
MSAIRQRLLLWLLSIVLLGMSLAAVAVYRGAQVELNAMFDRHLSQVAVSLIDQQFPDAFILGSLDREAQYDLVIQVWSEDGVRRYASHTHVDVPRPTRSGHETIHSREGDWRVFSVSGGGLTVEVSQPIRIRQALAAAAAWRTILPMVLILPLLGVAVWLVVGHGLKPLDTVAAAVRRRTPGSLTPLATGDLPEELRPMVIALNDMLARLGRALDAQRTFTADAAHELRTPLTALQLQLGLLQTAATDAERATALHHLEDAIERSVHLVQQLLTMARQDPDAVEAKFSVFELNPVVKDVLARQEPIARSRGIDLGMTRDDSVRLNGDSEALAILVNNLVDNAIRYTPSGGKVDVALRRQGNEALLEVSDTGPGIPLEDRERVFDRFHRRDHGSTSGSGLGLAIVRRVALRHQATVALLDNPDGQGLCARVTLIPAD